MGAAGLGTAGRFLAPITRPLITDGADLRRYVARVTLVATVLALAIETAMQMAFFTSWENVYRQWILDVVVAVATAVPVAMLIGRTHRDLHHAKSALERVSRTDALTDLPNRRAILEAATAPGSPAAVLAIVDIDAFKTVNDTFGHAVGDAVIRAVGQGLAEALGAIATVGRLGGEEFAVLASRAAAREVVEALDRFRAALAEGDRRIGGVALCVTVSAGIAIREGSDPFERLYAEADAALYAAKRSGRDRIALSHALRARIGAEAARPYAA